MQDDESLEHSAPVIEEELVTGARAVKTGSVRIHKEVERLLRTVEMPIVQDVAKVSRVAVNKVITSMPSTREVGDTLIVPVVEEQLVVSKRLVLKEEIHIRRERTQSRVSQSVPVEREHATVERLDEKGNVIAVSRPPRRGR